MSLNKIHKIANLLENTLKEISQFEDLIQSVKKKIELDIKSETIKQGMEIVKKYKKEDLSYQETKNLMILNIENLKNEILIDQKDVNEFEDILCTNTLKKSSNVVAIIWNGQYFKNDKGDPIYGLKALEKLYQYHKSLTVNLNIYSFVGIVENE